MVGTQNNRCRAHFHRPGNQTPNLGFAPDVLKWVRHNFAVCPTPQTDIAPIVYIKSQFTAKIWGPNSQPIFFSYPPRDVRTKRQYYSQNSVLNNEILKFQFSLKTFEIKIQMQSSLRLAKTILNFIQ